MPQKFVGGPTGSLPDSLVREVPVFPASAPPVPEPAHRAILESGGKKLRIDRGEPAIGDAGNGVPAAHIADAVRDRLELPPQRSDETFEEFVSRQGRAYDSYLATEPGRLHYWSRDRRGLVSYARIGRHVLVGGGLIAPAMSKANLLGEFVEFAERQRWRVTFFNIDDAELPLFREFKFQATKWGEEPVVDLADRTWSGKQFEWVRRQTNFCLRQGLVADEVRPEWLGATEWGAVQAELREISRSSLSRKAQRTEMTFFEGSIDHHELGWRRLFVARGDGGRGRIEGFVVCNPVLNGTAWSTELYRHRSDAVRGTVPFLFHHLMQKLKAEGIRSVGLCLDPGRNCAAPIAGDNWLVRRGMMLLERHLGFVFDVAGLRHFKSRFRPRYENRYICSRPKTSLGDIITFIRVIGAFRLDVSKLVRVTADRLHKRQQRKTLAEAD